jgi:hypothetical protein
MRIIRQSDYALDIYNKGAGKGTDKAVRKAILDTLTSASPVAINAPQGLDVDPEKEVGSSPHTSHVVSDVEKIYRGLGESSISLVVCGEDHTDERDHARAEFLIGAIAGGTIAPSIVLFERGMTYTTNGLACHLVRETNLTTAPAGDFGLGLSKSQRSMVVAGYMLLCVAGGDQSTIDRFFLFYGENHMDILTHFEYFVRHTSATWVQRRPRNLFQIRSHVS